MPGYDLGMKNRQICCPTRGRKSGVRADRNCKHGCCVTFKRPSRIHSSNLWHILIAFLLIAWSGIHVEEALILLVLLRELHFKQGVP